MKTSNSQKLFTFFLILFCFVGIKAQTQCFFCFQPVNVVHTPPQSTTCTEDIIWTSLPSSESTTMSYFAVDKSINGSTFTFFQVSPPIPAHPGSASANTYKWTDPNPYSCGGIAGNNIFYRVRAVTIDGITANYSPIRPILLRNNICGLSSSCAICTGTAVLNAPTQFCLNSSAQLVSVTGVNVQGATWSTSNPSVFTVSSSSITTAQITAVGVGTAILTVTLPNCGITRTKSIQIISAPTPAGQQATCKHLGGSYIPMLACNQFLQSDVVNPCPDGVIDPCYLQMQGRVVDPLATNFNFSIVYSTPLSSATLTTAGNTFTVNCRRWPNTGYVIVRCTTSNSCGSSYKDYTFYITNPCPGGNPEQRMTEITQSADDQNQVSKLAISPNPSTGQFVLALNTAHKTSLIKEVIITNKMGAVVYQQKFYSGQKTQTINLSDQSTDTYIVQVFDGKEWHAQKLALRK